MIPPLVLESPDGQHRLTLHAGQSLVIGRAPGADLVLADVTVARRHARVVHGPDGSTIEDLESPCGVVLNGMIARGPTEIRPGDVLRLGCVTLIVRAGQGGP